MMTTTCPNCGKPIRPGTKFCGNCGTTIASSIPTKAASLSSSREFREPQTSVNSCPHCGKPLRTNARFCNNCGKSILEGSHPEVVTPQIEPDSTPSSAQTLRSPQIPEVKSAPTEMAERKQRRKKVWIGVLIALFSISCIVVLAVVFLYLRDPFGWFIKPTFTATASQFVPTEEISEIPKTEVVVTATLTEASPLETEVTPSAITTTIGFPLITNSPIPLDTPTTGISNTAVPTTSQQGFVLFSDDFSTTILEYWKPWGDPNSWPSIKRIPDANKLELIAYEDPGEAGITSKIEINSSPGVEVVFEAQLNPNFPQFPLIFDWDPLNDPRKPDSEKFGVVHLEINTDRLVFMTPYHQQSTCMRLINGAQKYVYHIKFLESQGISMYVENSPTEPCSLPNMGKPPMPGRITFTGMGWLFNVIVTEP